MPRSIRTAAQLGDEDENEPNSCGEERNDHDGSMDLEPLSIGEGRTHECSKEDGSDSKKRPSNQHQNPMNTNECHLHGVESISFDRSSGFCSTDWS